MFRATLGRSSARLASVMASILIAYATGEGQTTKICSTLAHQLGSVGHVIDLVDLGSRNTLPNLVRYDAVIVAASVHAGKHQGSALRFVSEHAGELGDKTTAFLSVSISAATDAQAGRQRADEQVASFLEAVKWKPDFVEMLGGAIRYSERSFWWRWIMGLSKRLFKKELNRQGWPDLTIDKEFTDWSALRDFGKSFAAKL